MNSPIRLVIAEDFSIVRSALCALLESAGGLEVVGEACDGYEAIDQTVALQPDILLLDLVLPGKVGIEVIRELRQRQFNTRILVLTGVDDDEMMFTAIKAGADGYLLKTTPPAELIKMIRAVYADRLLLHPAVAHKFVHRLQQDAPFSTLADQLTQREREVLTLVAHGYDNLEIAETLCIGLRAVRSHLTQLQQKLAQDTPTRLALFALRHGVIGLDQVQVPFQQLPVEHASVASS